MRVFAIRDATLPGEKDLAYLLYYEASRRFVVELRKDISRWELPLSLGPFAEKGIQTLDFVWSRRWVEQRIIPPDRQNLGMILKEHGLTEYDPFGLLMITSGRCAQDDCYLVPLKEGDLPEELRQRMNRRVRELVHVREDRCLLIFGDGRIREIEFSQMLDGDPQLQRLLRYYRGLSGLRRAPGGLGAEWTEEQFISAETLEQLSEPAVLAEEDLRAYVQNNLVSSGEAAELLHCSRQNLNDLVRRGKLRPVREGRGGCLFLRRDVEERDEARRTRPLRTDSSGCCG